MAQQIVSIDIGGTNMAIAIFSTAEARPLSKARIPTRAAQGAATAFERMIAEVEFQLAQCGLTRADIAGIGVGAAGPLAIAEQRIQNPYTLPTWDDVPIGDWLRAQFDCPTVLLTDTQAAALGEHWQGAGTSTRNMVYVTISTGIGGGIIIDGKLYRGVGLLSGEVGHQVLDDSGPLCYCGAHGCWEMLASGTAISAAAQQRVTADSILMQLANGDPGVITAAMVATASLAGDDIALQVLKHAARYIGLGTANLMNILAPDCVVLGGGVMNSWSLLEADILAGIHERTGMVDFSPIQVVPAALGEDSGLFGAARMMMDTLGENLQQ